MFFLERPRLGDLLTRKGLITLDQLRIALDESQESGELLGRVLIRRRYLFDHDLARILAEQLDLPYVDIAVVGVDRKVARMLPNRGGTTRRGNPRRSHQRSRTSRFRRRPMRRDLTVNRRPVHA